MRVHILDVEKQCVILMKPHIKPYYKPTINWNFIADCSLKQCHRVGLPLLSIICKLP